jgi:NADP-dependent 3-hydroxy acid dehydrogenase YdfG
LEEAFKDEVFYITGSSGGIGLATARLCVEKGATVIITGRDLRILKKLKPIFLKSHLELLHIILMFLTNLKLLIL